MVRFERGVDFDTFDDFHASFLALLNERSKEWGRPQIRRMEHLGQHHRFQRRAAGVVPGEPPRAVEHR